MPFPLVIKAAYNLPFLLYKLSATSSILCLCVACALALVFYLVVKVQYQAKTIQDKINANNELSTEITSLRKEIKKRTKKLESAIQKSEESNRLKSLFLSNMSHEIRTPLNGIMGFSELITEEGISQDEQKLYSQHIIQNSLNLLNLIDQIFHLSIIETGKAHIHKSEFRISALFAEIQPTFESKLAIKNNDIHFSINLENDDYQINTDKEKLSLILVNLFDNAIKFTNRGVIELTCVRLEQDYMFQITDSGSGINEDELEMIFEPFTQGTDALKNIKGGSGLGLSNVKNYVNLLGGRIWCDQNKPNGSIFTFTIPAPKLNQPELTKLLKYSLS